MIRRPPRSTPKPSSAASDVYKRQVLEMEHLVAPLRRLGQIRPRVALILSVEVEKPGSEPKNFSKLTTQRLTRLTRMPPHLGRPGYHPGHPSQVDPGGPPQRPWASAFGVAPGPGPHGPRRRSYALSYVLWPCPMASGPVPCLMASPVSCGPLLCPMALSYVLWPCAMPYGPVLCPLAMSSGLSCGTFLRTGGVGIFL